MANDREAAWKLLNQYTESESLIKHMLAVEAAMRYYARRSDGDEELWGLTGLLHDFDYEKYPTAEEHPETGMRILREHGWPEEMITAIGGHATYLNIPRETEMAKTLFAVDELCGFLTACAYVKPSRKIVDVEVSSVKKKLKDKSFARSVNRDDIALGIEELGIPIDEHISHCIAALTEAAPSLGL
jgi:putative nucleotidyltransferase with HDIG domain